MVEGHVRGGQDAEARRQEVDEGRSLARTQLGPQQVLSNMTCCSAICSFVLISDHPWIYCNMLCNY